MRVFARPGGERLGIEQCGKLGLTERLAARLIGHSFGAVNDGLVRRFADQVFIG